MLYALTYMWNLKIQINTPNYVYDLIDTKQNRVPDIGSRG